MRRGPGGLRAAGLLWLALWGASLPAQVVQVSAGSSSVADTAGGGVTVYTGGAESRLSLGSAQGLRLGFSREVETDTGHLTVGDTAPSLALLTDGPQTQRTVYGRGLRLQTQGAGRETEVFVGRSGEQRGSGLFSAVLPDKHLLLLNAVAHAGDTAFQTVIVEGSQRSALTSLAKTLSPQTAVAMTAGWCGHTLIVRGWMHTEGATWRLDVGDTSGHLQLQPEPRLQQFAAEQIGLNVLFTKRLGRRVTVDLERHEYATSATDVQSSTYDLGARSILWEAGTVLQMGKLQAGVRGLLSQNVNGLNGGLAWMAGWRRQRWDTRLTVLNRSSPAEGKTSTVQMDAGERVQRHLRLEQGVQLGNSAPRFDAGGALESNRGSVSVSHGVTFVPYGPSTGFHRTLSVTVQWHLRNATVQATRVSASGIESEYEGSVTDFEGSGVSPGSGVHTASVRMLKYRLQGVVREVGGAPVAGAAVAVGMQMVYTDTEGQWMARFASARPVRVAIQSSQFLTTQGYEAVSAARMEMPAVSPAALELRVSRCRPAMVPLAAEREGGEQDGNVALAKPRRFGALGVLCLRLLRVWSR